jgi:DNA-directed RNA polymerase subunit beta'
MAEQPPLPGDRDVARLRLASPEQIRSWSSGEVTEPATYQPRSGKPVPGGLFCEKVFGPLHEFRCRCGLVRGQRTRERRCQRCDSPVLRRRGRRRRMGHIDLAAPVAHIWFLKARPSPMALLLDVKRGKLEQILRGQAWLVLKSDCENLPAGKVLTRRQRDQALRAPGAGLVLSTGAEAIEQALAAIDLAALADTLRQREAALREESDQTVRRQAVLRRLRLVLALQAGQVRPEWMILRRLPVVGPALRPIVRLASGKYASSELNDLYLHVLRRNNLLRQLQSKRATEGMIRDAQLNLQMAVDWLFDNRRSQRPFLGPRRQPVRSLSDLLSGKQGRFRGNLLGKRVDYSARSVIVVGPELKLHQVGLPRVIALRLFEPLLLGHLRRAGWTTTLRRGRQLLHELAYPELLVDTARLIVRELARVQHLAHVRLLAAQKEETADPEVLALRESARAFVKEQDTAELRSHGRAILDELPSTETVEEVREALRSQGRKAARQLAHRMLLGRQAQLEKLVRQTIAGHPVLLNRAPTLHRMGIQAFEPVLVEGNAIHLHPLVCKAFNADFDGDQMAVHLPLSEAAIREALSLMTPARNLFNPANSTPITTPSQDVVLGCYYLTAMLPQAEAGKNLSSAKQTSLPSNNPHTSASVGEGSKTPIQFTPPTTDHGGGRAFAGSDAIGLAYELGKLGIHARIRMRLPPGTLLDTGDEQTGPVRPSNRLIETTTGRVLFNALLPPGLPFYNLTLNGKWLSRILASCHLRLGPRRTVELIDRLKQAGFQAATRSGVSLGIDDVPLARDKPAVLKEAHHKAARLREEYETGNASEADHADRVVDLWTAAHKQATASLMPDLMNDHRGGKPYLNPLFVMADSGARGSIDQIRQLAGMRGLMASVSGRLIERPITASLREGLPSWDFFVSAHGGRKGLTDKGVRTAEAGYLMRKLVDAAQQVIVTIPDCGTSNGVLKRAPGSLGARVRGRVSLEEVRDEQGRVVVDKNELISPGQARRLSEMQHEVLRVRSPLTCEAPHGVCQRCYGIDLSTRRLVALGTPVGVIAAQSIGEPGTQLTLNTFRLGRVAGKDIVNDLEKVTRLLEASPPSRPAVLAPRAGLIRIVRYDLDQHGPPRLGWWLDRFDRLNGRALRVHDRQIVAAGTPLTEGDVDLQQMLALAGPVMVGEHVLESIRQAYRYHGLEIDDRHFEVILERMLSSVSIHHPGDTGLLHGQAVDRRVLHAAHRRLREGQQPAEARPCLLGVSAVAGRTAGFLAAASFQRAVKVLSEAALAGQVDRLSGLKENVILGRRIPAGTGARDEAQEG